MKKFKITLMSLFIAFFISACGGGGGGTTDGSQSQNSGGDAQGTQTSSQSVESFSNQASKFSDSYKYAQNSFYNTYSNLTDGFKKTYDRKNLTTKEMSDFWINIYSTNLYLLNAANESYKLTEISENVSQNRVGFEKRTVAGAAKSVATLALKLYKTYNGLSKILDKNTLVAISFIQKVPANKLPEVAKKIGLSPNKSRKDLVEELTNLGISNKFVASNRIMWVAQEYTDSLDSQMSDAAFDALELQRSTIPKIAKELYVLGGNIVLDEYLRVAAADNGAVAQVLDFIKVTSSDNPIDLIDFIAKLGRHPSIDIGQDSLLKTVLISISKKTENDSSKKSGKTTDEAKKIVEEVISDTDTNKKTEEVEDATNKLKENLARKANAIKSENSQTIETVLPEKVSIKKIDKVKDGDTIKMPNIGLSDIVSIVGTKVVNVIENVATNVSNTIDLIGSSTQVNDNNQATGSFVTTSLYEKALYHIYYIASIKTSKPNTKVTLTDSDKREVFTTKSDGTWRVRVKVTKEDRTIRFYNHDSGKSQVITFDGINSVYRGRIARWKLVYRKVWGPCRDKFSVGDVYNMSIYSDYSVRNNGKILGYFRNDGIINTDNTPVDGETLNAATTSGTWHFKYEYILSSGEKRVMGCTIVFDSTVIMQ